MPTIFVTKRNGTKEELNIDIYTNQYEVVTSEQLLDAMSLIGLPISYPHWSFGKNFSQQQSAYKRGQASLKHSPSLLYLSSLLVP